MIATPARRVLRYIDGSESESPPVALFPQVPAHLDLGYLDWDPVYCQQTRRVCERENLTHAPAGVEYVGTKQLWDRRTVVVSPGWLR